ncbi:MAG TPA: winged helix-turn-helix domain-containing protein [Candidatus Limnocylindrales bacterium]
MTPRRPLLLVIDGDPTRLMLLADRLRGDGYEVTAAATRDRVIESLETDPPDVAILGPSIMGGEEALVATWVRERVTAPILQLRDHLPTERLRRELRDRMLVDRVLTTPFRHDELLDAIEELLLARTEGPTAFTDELALDREAGTAHLGNRVVHLSPLETALVAALLREPGVAVSTARLIAEVWPDDRTPDPASMWILVWRVRQKIEADPKRPTILVSVPGAGYRLDVRVPEGERERGDGDRDEGEAGNEGETGEGAGHDGPDESDEDAASAG